MIYILIVLMSYFAGSFNGAYYIGKKSGMDIREMGSGNAGARNAGRHLGAKGFICTVILDAVKSLAALYAADMASGGNEWLLLSCSGALLAGHIWPAGLQFKGGKGVVVYLACVLYLVPPAIPIAGAALGAGYILCRNFTGSGLSALLSIPVSAWIFGETALITAGLFVLLGAVLAAHTGLFKRKALNI